MNYVNKQASMDNEQINPNTSHLTNKTKPIIINAEDEVVASSHASFGDLENDKASEGKILPILDTHGEFCW
jgi:hypothetical protein